MFIPVMMTWQNAYSTVWKKERPLQLEAYRLNLSTAIGFTQVESRFVICEGHDGPFESPLVRIDYPGADAEGETISVYVSGLVDEIEARYRDARA